MCVYIYISNEHTYKEYVYINMLHIYRNLRIMKLKMSYAIVKFLNLDWKRLKKLRIMNFENDTLLMIK